MEDRFSQIKSTLDQLFSLVEKELLSQREEIEVLKKTVAALQKEQAHTPAAPQVTSAPQQEVHRVEAEEPIAPQVHENEHSDQREPEQEFSFEDDAVFEVHDLNEEMGGRKILGELFSSEDSVADYAIKQTQPWMTDIPGTKVDTVEEAISLNDRMYFIRELFGGDEDQFDLTLERIDETPAFKEVVNDMRATFPEWDETSNDVYRFYMIVRRKFRD